MRHDVADCAGRPGTVVAAAVEFGTTRAFQSSAPERMHATARIANLHAEGILAYAGPSVFMGLVESLPEEMRTDALRQVYGEALALAGDIKGARAQYELVADRRGALRLSPGLARRLGYLDYRTGDPQAALSVLALGLDGGGPGVDRVRLISLLSLAHWAAGDGENAAAAAEQAFRAAAVVDDYRAAIAAHLALALTAEVRGEPEELRRRHYSEAFELAVGNGDSMREAAVGTEYAGRLLGEGRPAEALAAAERSAYSAEANGVRVIVGAALAVAGTALHRLGRLDEALDRFERAAAVERRIGSSWLARPLLGIGAVHQVRSGAPAALAAYDEATRIAAQAGDVFALVPALAGQACVLAEHEPTAAAQAAERALLHARGALRAEALLAVGHAVRGAGDVAGAARIAQESAGQARLYRNRAGLARALELSAATAAQPRAARRALAEALRIWRELGAEPDADRVRAVLGARADASAAQRVAGRVARERLSAAGIASPAESRRGAGAAVGVAAGAGAGRVEIRTLGRLAVLIDGEPVPAAAWQSRKARALLRILVARRGRAIPREQIANLLWGDGAPGPVGHRLSVALSTVRSVLDPDRRHEAGYFITSDSGSVALDTSRVAVDVEWFLTEAGRGLRLHERGERVQALEVLTAAQVAYVGDFLEDEPYDDWTAAVRETARVMHLRCARVLADLHRGLGDTAGALCSLYRILDKDPYDERCHREIIETLDAAGSHGEARRARERYAAAMRSLSVEG